MVSRRTAKERGCARSWWHDAWPWECHSGGKLIAGREMPSVDGEKAAMRDQHPNLGLN
jgi:hypothetical protein